MSDLSYKHTFPEPVKEAKIKVNIASSLELFFNDDTRINKSFWDYTVENDTMVVKSSVPFTLIVSTPIRPKPALEKVPVPIGIERDYVKVDGCRITASDVRQKDVKISTLEDALAQANAEVTRLKYQLMESNHKLSNRNRL